MNFLSKVPLDAGGALLDGGVVSDCRFVGYAEGEVFVEGILEIDTDD